MKDKTICVRGPPGPAGEPGSGSVVTYILNSINQTNYVYPPFSFQGFIDQSVWGTLVSGTSNFSLWNFYQWDQTNGDEGPFIGNTAQPPTVALDSYWVAPRDGTLENMNLFYAYEGATASDIPMLTMQIYKASPVDSIFNPTPLAISINPTLPSPVVANNMNAQVSVSAGDLIAMQLILYNPDGEQLFNEGILSISMEFN